MSTQIPIARVVTATGGRLASATASHTFTAVVIDGRQAGPGALFFAIKGERFDGHDFVAQAAAQGAGGAVVVAGRVETAKLPPTFALIEVADTIAALGALAAAHRASLPALKVVAITGSNGKTSTKDMIAEICSAAFGAAAVAKTQGNLNNHLGVPLTLLTLNAQHRVAVVEMGMSALGEIDYLTRLARPDVAVIVNVAPVHLETLGTIENIARAKAEIFHGLSPHGVAIVPANEPLLVPFTRALTSQSVLHFRGGEGDTPDASATLARGGTLRLHIAGKESTIQWSLIGDHQASNAAAAALAAQALGADLDAITTGLANVRAAKHRNELVTIAGRRILDDCYNASPLSMRAAIEALVGLAAGGQRTIAVVGDMLELGPDSPTFHAEVGRFASDHGIDTLVGIGPLSTDTVNAAKQKLAGRAYHFTNAAAAVATIAERARPGDIVLVKASRGMHLETLIDPLRQAWEAV